MAKLSFTSVKDNFAIKFLFCLQLEPSVPSFLISQCIFDVSMYTRRINGKHCYLYHDIFPPAIPIVSVTFIYISFWNGSLRD